MNEYIKLPFCCEPEYPEIQQIEDKDFLFSMFLDVAQCSQVVYIWPDFQGVFICLCVILWTWYLTRMIIYMNCILSPMSLVLRAKFQALNSPDENRPMHSKAINMLSCLCDLAPCCFADCPIVILINLSCNTEAIFNTYSCLHYEWNVSNWLWNPG